MPHLRKRGHLEKLWVNDRGNGGQLLVNLFSERISGGKKTGGKRSVTTGRKPAADSSKPKTTGRRIIGDVAEKRTRQGKRK